jgi:hypothetical protein
MKIEKIKKLALAWAKASIKYEAAHAAYEAYEAAWAKRTRARRERDEALEALEEYGTVNVDYSNIKNLALAWAKANVAYDAACQARGAFDHEDASDMYRAARMERAEASVALDEALEG